VFRYRADPRDQDVRSAELKLRRAVEHPRLGDSGEVDVQDIVGVMWFRRILICSRISATSASSGFGMGAPYTRAVHYSGRVYPLAYPTTMGEAAVIAFRISLVGLLEKLFVVFDPLQQLRGR
jgi:hypothetical protein